jgi:hypothetical protein
MDRCELIRMDTNVCECVQMYGDESSLGLFGRNDQASHISFGALTNLTDLIGSYQDEWKF